MLIREIILGFLILANADIYLAGEQKDYADTFGRILVSAGIRLQEAAQKRPLRLKHLNDSLSATAEAARGMASKRWPSEVEEILRRARQSYDGNSFALLLMAVLRDSEGDTAHANRLFEDFLMQSRTFTDFEKTFLTWDEFHKLRRIVFELLSSRGVEFSGREEQIQVQIPFESLMQYVRDPSREDRFWNLFFIGTIFLGIFLIFGAALMGVDLSSFGARSFIYFYAVTWLCYVLWFLDLAIGLPWGMHRSWVVPALLSVTVILRMAQGSYGYWRRKTEPMVEGYRRCPGCGAVIEKLRLECPKCRKEV